MAEFLSIRKNLSVNASQACTILLYTAPHSLSKPFALESEYPPLEGVLAVDVQRRAENRQRTASLPVSQYKEGFCTGAEHVMPGDGGPGVSTRAATNSPAANMFKTMARRSLCRAATRQNTTFYRPGRSTAEQDGGSRGELFLCFRWYTEPSQLLDTFKDTDSIAFADRASAYQVLRCLSPAAR